MFKALYAVSLAENFFSEHIFFFLVQSQKENYISQITYTLLNADLCKFFFIFTCGMIKIYNL